MQELRDVVDSESCKLVSRNAEASARRAFAEYGPTDSDPPSAKSDGTSTPTHSDGQSNADSQPAVSTALSSTTFSGKHSTSSSSMQDGDSNDGSSEHEQQAGDASSAPSDERDASDSPSDDAHDGGQKRRQTGDQMCAEPDEMSNGGLGGGLIGTSVPAPATSPALKPGDTKRSNHDDSFAPQRRCESCGTTETPKWRSGTTLCNACGLREAKKMRCSASTTQHAFGLAHPGAAYCFPGMMPPAMFGATNSCFLDTHTRMPQSLSHTMDVGAMASHPGLQAAPPQMVHPYASARHPSVVSKQPLEHTSQLIGAPLAALAPPYGHSDLSQWGGFRQQPMMPASTRPLQGWGCGPLGTKVVQLSDVRGINRTGDEVFMPPPSTISFTSPLSSFEHPASSHMRQQLPQLAWPQMGGMMRPPQQPMGAGMLPPSLFGTPNAGGMYQENRSIPACRQSFTNSLIGSYPPFNPGWASMG